MRKRYLIPAVVVAALVIGGSLIVVLQSNRRSSQGEQADCSSLPVAQLDSERSQGLIIKDKMLLVVKLDQESNYSVPGGHVDYGENTVNALAREISEEVGIKADPSSFQYYKTDCVPKNGLQQRITFYLVGSYQDNITLENKQDKVRWVGYDFEAKKKADTDVKLALYYLKQDGLVE